MSAQIRLSSASLLVRSLWVRSSNCEGAPSRSKTPFMDTCWFHFRSPPEIRDFFSPTSRLLALFLYFRLKLIYNSCTFYSLSQQRAIYVLRIRVFDATAVSLPRNMFSSNQAILDRNDTRNATLFDCIKTACLRTPEIDITRSEASIFKSNPLSLA